MDIPHDHVVAEGPEGLMQVLKDLSQKSKNDPAFAKEDHYILYQLGGQKSLILVDATQVPFHLWHYDLMGRSATIAVKETLKRFLSEQSGKSIEEQFSRLFDDVSGYEFTQRNREFIEFGGRVDVVVGQHSEPAAHDKLKSAKTASLLSQSLATAKVATSALQRQAENAKKSSGIRLLGLFGRFGTRRKDQPAQQSESSNKNKPKK